MLQTNSDFVRNTASSDYETLRRIARRQLKRLPPGQTLSATALVHEAYVKVAKKSLEDGLDEQQILMMLSFAIRDVLVQHVRSKLRRLSREDAYGVLQTQLRGDHLLPNLLCDAEILRLDDALRRLEEIDSTKSEVVILHAFGELSLESIADVLGVSHSSIKRRWRAAKAWLASELSN